jgi:hypothetical protein
MKSFDSTLVTHSQSKSSRENVGKGENAYLVAEECRCPMQWAVLSKYSVPVILKWL